MGLRTQGARDVGVRTERGLEGQRRRTGGAEMLSGVLRSRGVGGNLGFSPLLVDQLQLRALNEQQQRGRRRRSRIGAWGE